MENKHRSELEQTQPIQPVNFEDSKKRFLKETSVKVTSPEASIIADVIACLSKTYSCNPTSPIIFSPEEKRFFQYITLT